jgi:hypothetical protein
MRKFTKDKDDYEKPYLMCVVGGYELNLYCANAGHADGRERVKFGGLSKSEVFEIAESEGWVVSEEDDLAICPDCVREGKL